MQDTRHVRLRRVPFLDYIHGVDEADLTGSGYTIEQNVYKKWSKPMGFGRRPLWVMGCKLTRRIHFLWVLRGYAPVMGYERYGLRGIRLY